MISTDIDPTKDKSWGGSYGAWREAHGFSLCELEAKLAEVAGHPVVTYASLSRLENGKTPYDQEILEALTTVYGIAPGLLLEAPPPARPKSGC